MERWSLNPTQVLSRKSIAREGVFPEDVAVAAVAAVIQHCRLALTLSRFRSIKYITFIFRVSPPVQTASRWFHSQTLKVRAVFLHASTSGVVIWLPVNPALSAAASNWSALKSNHIKQYGCLMLSPENCWSLKWNNDIDDNNVDSAGGE